MYLPRLSLPRPLPSPLPRLLPIVLMVDGISPRPRSHLLLVDDVALYMKIIIN